MEASPFVSLAQIRVLLIPIGSIRRSAFERYAGLVKSFGNIRLGDIPPDPREDKNRFIPSPLSSGHLHLSFTTHPPPSWYSVISLFRISAFPLAVIGIANYSQDTSLSSFVAEFKATLSALFPPGSPFPFASKCFAFEEGEGNANLNLGTSLPELVAIPSLMGNKQVYIGTLLAELCHDILGEFPALVRALDSAEGVEALSSQLLPIVSSLDGPGTFTILNGASDYINGSLRHSSAPPGPSTLSRSSTFYELGSNGLSSRASVPILQRGTNGLESSSSSSPQRLGVSMAKKRASTAAPSSGRVAKIVGDLYLLSGKLTDANYWYTEAISLFRTQQDSIWNASALEGQCIVEVLEAWSLGDSLHMSLGGNPLADPWANVSDKMGQAINLYSRAAPTSPQLTVTADSEVSSIVLLYTDAILRYGHLLFSIWSGKGWNPLSLSSMLNTSLPPTFSPDRPSSTTLFRMSSLTNITRSQISAIISQAHGPFLLHLQPPDQIRILSFLAALYSCLDFKRKEVFVLREVQAAVMNLIVVAREESRNTAVKEIMSGRSSPGFMERDSPYGAVGVRETESGEGNSSVVRIAQYIAGVYGIDLSRVRIRNVEDLASESTTGDESLGPPSGVPSKTSEGTRYGWPELQVGVVREAVAIAEALPEHKAVAQIALSTLRSLHRFLTAQEQYHLYSSAVRGIATSRRRGDNARLEYWAEDPVIGIDVSPLPLGRLPSEHPRRELDNSTNNAVTTVSSGTFIYHPKGKKATTSQILVQNESVEFFVTLQNPYLFDFDIQSIILSTSGIPFHSEPLSCVIPANSFHVISLSGIALEPGTLTIRGCHIQLAGGTSREFLVPLTDDDDIRVPNDGNAERIKSSGLEANILISEPLAVSFKTRRKLNSGPPRFLQCEVAPEQPLLRIRRSSLVHGALMLYDGESSNINLIVENISSLPVDFYKLTFEDSTMGPAQQALAEGDLSVAEAYETEYDLIRRPFFRWSAPSELPLISPAQKNAITVSCTGKIGCTYGTIKVAYGYAHRNPATNESDIFHARHISYPVNVTVYHNLECSNLEILPFNHFDNLPALDPSASEEERSRRTLFDVGIDASYCLVSVDVTNVYGLPFEVTIERHQDDTPPASMIRVIPPGSTSRLFIPVKRVLLSPEEASMPIPSLSNRQFVVAKDKLSAEAERLQRELFWYREKLFEIVQGRWIEPGTKRTGVLSLRSQRLSISMRDSFRRDLFKVNLSFEADPADTQDSEESEPVVRREGEVWRIRPYELVYLVTNVQNSTTVSRNASWSCRTVPPTLGEHAVFEGWLSDNYLGDLASEQSASHSIAVYFVAEGTFDLRVDILEVGAYGLPLPDQEKNITSAIITAVVG